MHSRERSSSKEHQEDPADLKPIYFGDMPNTGGTLLHKRPLIDAGMLETDRRAVFKCIVTIGFTDETRLKYTESILS